MNNHWFDIYINTTKLHTGWTWNIVSFLAGALHDLRYMNSNLLLINRFGNFFFVILYVDIYNLISWLQNDKSIIKVYDFIQNIPHSYDKLSHIYNNITFGFEYAIIVVKSRVDHK